MTDVITKPPPKKLIRRKPQSQPPDPPARLVRRKQGPKMVHHEPAQQRVSAADRRPDWPKLSDDLEDTEYVTVDGKLSGLVTDCKGLSVGWDLCGRCRLHIVHCRCYQGIGVPRSIVFIWRSTHGIDYVPETAGGGPYIGMRHNPKTGEAKPMVFVPPVRKVVHQAPAPAPLVPTLARRRPAPQQAVPQPVRRTPAPSAAQHGRGRAEQVSTKLIRRTPSKKGG